jgi:hypothetical protein
LSPKIVRCNALHPFIAAPLAATSRNTIAASVIPRPPPPDCYGNANPTQPPAALWA